MPSPATRADTSRARPRTLFETYAPFAAIGVLLLLLWSFVTWFLIATPAQLREEQRQEQANAAQAAAEQTEAVFRDAERSLRTVDLWLLTRGGREALSDASLVQLAETLRDTSRGIVDVMLMDERGQVFRIPSIRKQALAGWADLAWFPRLHSDAYDGRPVLGQPLRLPDKANEQLPLVLRLSAPAEELRWVVALIDLRRLAELHEVYARGPSSAVAMVDGDSIALLRVPAVPGFVGRRLFPSAERQADFAQAQGFFTTSGIYTDGIRHGAYRKLGMLGLNLLLSQGESAALAKHRRERAVVLGFSLLVSLGALLTAWQLSRLQKRARLEDAIQRAVSEASPLGLFRCELDGRVSYCNPTYLDLHGLREDEMEWGWVGLLQEDKREQARRHWAEQIGKGERLKTFSRITRRDGSRRLMAVRTAPLWLDGRLRGQVGTLEDITELAEQERASRALNAIFTQTPDYVCQLDQQFRISYLNPAARQRLGVAADADVGELDYTRFFSSGGAQRFHQEVLPAAQQQGHWLGRGNLQDKDGQPVPCDITVLLHRNGGGRMEAISVVLRDISSELRAQRERQRSEAMMRAIARTSQVMISVLDLEGRFLYCNQAFEQRYDIEPESWLGRSLVEVLGEEEYEARREAIALAMAGEASQLERTYDGLSRPPGHGEHKSERQERDDSRLALVLELRFTPLRSEGELIEGVICVAIDITEARREEQRLRDASQTCPLTRLLNRRGFTKLAQDLMDRPARPGSFSAVLYLDLDRFKAVNDEHGHPVGDALLKAVARRMRNALRPQDLVARLGGDEFAVLLPELQQREDARHVAEKLVHAIGMPFSIDGLELQVGMSVGFCVLPAGQLHLERMVAKADIKLYEAKRAGRNCARGNLDEEAG